MSFQSIDPDNLEVFSSTSHSTQCVDSPVRLYGNVNRGMKDEGTKEFISSRSIADKGSLYQALFLPDVVPKQGEKKHESQENANTHYKMDWLVNDFCSIPSSTSQLNTNSIKGKSTNVSSSSVSISWTSQVADQNKSLSLNDGGRNILSEEEDNLSDAYESVNFDLPASPRNHVFEQDGSRSLRNVSHLSGIDAVTSTDIPPGSDSVQSINNPCFEAAVNEHYGKKKNTTSQYISKIKKDQHRHLTKSQAYDKERRSPAFQFSPQHLSQSQRKQKQETLKEKLKIELQRQQQKKEQQEALESGMTSHVLIKSQTSSAHNGDVLTKTTFASFTMPNMPPLSPLSSSSVSPSPSDGAKSPMSTKLDIDLKKHRYNQTAAALQQSGLMKITIKTAELLRKSRDLQQELNKLRKESALFVQAVLNNPENKHLKDLYLLQQKNHITG